jgi:hypothetical protein
MSMNAYVAMYRGKQIEVKGEDMTKMQAQQVAAKQFRAKHCWDVTVMLAEKDGKEVVHVADF